MVANSVGVPPPRRGRTLATVIGVMLAVCCAGGTSAALVGGVLGRPDNHAAGEAGGSRAESAIGSGGPALPGLNQPVRDGKFEFVVRALSCGQRELSRDWLRATAQGQFCVVELHVTNIGDEARRFADGSQKAYGPEGNLYAADTGAGVVANGNGDAIWNVVNPGNAITARIVFDIPVTASIATLELHDSPLSGGVSVRVGAP